MISLNMYSNDFALYVFWWFGYHQAQTGGPCSSPSSLSLMVCTWLKKESTHSDFCVVSMHIMTKRRTVRSVILQWRFQQKSNNAQSFLLCFCFRHHFFLFYISYKKAINAKSFLFLIYIISKFKKSTAAPVFSIKHFWNLLWIQPGTLELIPWLILNWKLIDLISL